MKLLCDLGNTRMKWALWDGALSGFGSAAYVGENDFTSALLGLKGAPSAVAAISVAPRLHGLFTEFCERHWRLTPRWYGACREAAGIRSLYEPPGTLGADRFAALAGARARAGRRSVSVVDCGTAITVDALDGEGVFQGGVIMPGQAASAEALRRIAEALAVTEGTGVVSALGRRTPDALRGGLVIGAAGAIDRVLDEQRSRFADDPLVLVTGGDAGALAPYLKSRHEIVPHLTLEGLVVMTI